MFALRGSGGMAKAVAFALKNAGFKQGYIIATNERPASNLQSNLVTSIALICRIFRLICSLMRRQSAWLGADADKLAFTETEVDRAKIVLMLWRCPPSPRLSAMLRLREKQ